MGLQERIAIRGRCCTMHHPNQELIFFCLLPVIRDVMRLPVTHSFYQMFATGCCARSGDIVKQDRAYTIEVLMALLVMYAAQYSDLGDGMQMNSICSCMFLLLTCLGGMRGYEALWTDLATLRYDLVYCESIEDYSAVAWPIVGRFKAHNGIAGCYLIPIAETTDSGITFFK